MYRAPLLHKLTGCGWNTLRICNISSQTNQRQNRPLVVLLPWLGATPRATEKYINLYNKLNCDVVSRKSTVKDFLWPIYGLKESQKFLHKVQKEMHSDDTPIFIHSMSIGSYFYALMLMCLEKEPQVFTQVSSNICCQVIDSPVVGTLNQMAFGVAQMITKSKIMHKILQSLIQAYFATTKPYTVKYYEQSIDAIQNRSPKVPAVFMSSLSDPMMVSHALKDFENAWVSRGIEVTVKMWENSEHAQHLRNHPDEYENVIQSLVNKALKQ
uniref:Uncharacterized protein LOC100186401 n=1 Tax=Phallusia mammillata TaxID=59560 RepID=A0A6F9DHV7_9ASCI|nr:uncharacterized protein LOC100186401 [Phallusia mammillata]